MSRVLVLVGSANEGVIPGTPAAVIGASPSSGETAGACEVLHGGLRRSGAARLTHSFGVAKVDEHLGDGGYGPEIFEPLHALLQELASVRD